MTSIVDQDCFFVRFRRLETSDWSCGKTNSPIKHEFIHLAGIIFLGVGEFFEFFFFQFRHFLLSFSLSYIIHAGDSMGAIIGSIYGVHYWPSSKKTIEGTVAAFLGIMFTAVNFGIVCSRLESCAVDSTDSPFLQSKLMYWRAHGNLLPTNYFDSLYRFFLRLASGIATFLACVLEASTAQIDNLVLPPFYYSLLVVASYSDVNLSEN
jgi:dolichol kinase